MLKNTGTSGRFLAATSWIVMTTVVTGTASPLDDWPYWQGPGEDSVWRETGILERFPDGGPTIKWRIPVSPGYSGPSVAEGRLYLTERLAEEKDEADEVPGIPGSERVFCVSTETGDLIWEQVYECRYMISYPEGPRTSPVIDGDRVYTLGAMGHLKCWEATSGDLIWESQLADRYKAEPPVWGFAATPRVDGDRLICVVGGEGSAVIALNKHTGDEIWTALTAEEVGYAPPVIHEIDGQRQMIFWHDVAVNSLNPETGELFWTVTTPDIPDPMRPVVTIVTPRFIGDRVFVSDFYNGSALIRVASDPPRGEIVWRDEPNAFPYRDELNSLMTTPVMMDGHIYGVSGDGELRCLRAEDGSLVWRDRSPIAERQAYFATLFIVENEGRFFLFNDQGYLIIANLSIEGYEELDRVKLLEPTGFARGRNIVWSHPAFANRCMYARNDDELICVDLAAPQTP